MSRRFEELAWSETPMGDLTLRRRLDPQLGVDVYEVKLGDEFLMSSLFTVAEIELARLGLAAIDGGEGGDGGDGLDVVVGGLGLGYTARAALDDRRVRSVTVVEALPEVIDWHRRDLLPATAGLAADPRLRFAHADFFATVASAAGFDPDEPDRAFDAVLLDVDHSPRHVLHPSHGPFYTTDGMRALRRVLRPGGVFALWSDDPPATEFEAVLATVFRHTTSHVVDFPNPLTGGTSANTVYVAR
jgi:SAM-dependent methyltransferase